MPRTAPDKERQNPAETTPATGTTGEAAEQSFPKGGNINITLSKADQ